MTLLRIAPAKLLTVVVLLSSVALMPARALADSGDRPKCLQAPPAVGSQADVFTDVTEAATGLFVGAGDGLHQGDESFAPVTPAVGTVTVVAVSKDRQEVAAIGLGRMLRSHDGGSTFTVETLPAKTPFYGAAFAGHQLLVFSSTGNAYAISPDKFVQEISLPAQSTWLSASFVSDKKGYLLGACNTLLTTEDGGGTWTLLPDPPLAVQAVMAVGDAVYLAGELGLDRSDDHGKSFEHIPSAKGKGCTHLAGLDGAVVAGCRSTPPLFDDGLWFAEDGKEFEPLVMDAVAAFGAVALPSDGTIVATTSDGALIRGRSTDLKFVFDSIKSRKARKKILSERLRRQMETVSSSLFASFKSPNGAPPPAGTALSPSQQKAFLFSRLKPTTAEVAGAFEGVRQTLRTAEDVRIGTLSWRIEGMGIRHAFTKDAPPTWQEFFDELARQTRSTWHYDFDRAAWIFESPRTSLPYTLKLPRGWSSQDYGDSVLYGLPGKAPAAAVYLTNRYGGAVATSDELQKRDENAIATAATVKDGVTVRDMKVVKVDGTDAVFFEGTRAGATWRQWAIVKNGWSFLIVSSLAKDQEDWLPEVKYLVSSFHVEPPETAGEQ